MQLFRELNVGGANSTGNGLASGLTFLRCTDKEIYRYQIRYECIHVARCQDTT